MTQFLIGLLIFLGTHAFTMARGPRAALVGRLGEGGYKVAYALVSLAGFYLLVGGYGAWREAGVPQLWFPPVAMRHAVLLLMWPAMVLLVAAYAPPAGIIKARAKHPMLLAVKIWASSHLLANGDLATIVLCLAFLAWAVAARINLKRRPGVVLAQASGFTRGDAIALGVGTLAWAAFIGGLHRLLIGVGVVG